MVVCLLSFKTKCSDFATHVHDARTHLYTAGQEEQEEREQAGHTQGKVFTPGDFGPPRIAGKPTQVRT